MIPSSAGNQEHVCDNVSQLGNNLDSPEDARAHTHTHSCGIISYSQMIINNFVSQHIIADERINHIILFRSSSTVPKQSRARSRTVARHVSLQHL